MRVEEIFRVCIYQHIRRTVRNLCSDNRCIPGSSNKRTLLDQMPPQLLPWLPCLSRSSTGTGSRSRCSSTWDSLCSDISLAYCISRSRRSCSTLAIAPSRSRTAKNTQTAAGIGESWRLSNDSACYIVTK